MFVDRFLSIVLYSLFGPRSTQPSQVQWERGARRHFGSALLFALHQWKWGWREHGHCRYAASNGRTQILHSQVTDKMSRSNCCCCHLYITGNSTAVGSLITSSEPRKKKHGLFDLLWTCSLTSLQFTVLHCSTSCTTRAVGSCQPARLTCSPVWLACSGHPFVAHTYVHSHLFAVTWFF